MGKSPLFPGFSSHANKDAGACRVIFSDYLDDRFTGIREDLDLWIGTTDGAAPIRINDTFDYDGRHAY